MSWSWFFSFLSVLCPNTTYSSRGGAMLIRVILKNVGAFYSVLSWKFIMPGAVKDT